MELTRLFFDPATIWWSVVATALIFSVSLCLVWARRAYDRAGRFSIDLGADPDVIARSIWRRARAKGQTTSDGTERHVVERASGTSLLRQLWYRPSAARNILRILVATFIAFPLFEFIANDKPIVIWYKHLPYFPALRSYQETQFGGDFDANADYRDPYLQKLILENGWMIWPPIRYHYATHNLDACVPAPNPPPWSPAAINCPDDGHSQSNNLGNRNWLGTDDQGRDVIARTIYGARQYLLIGAAVTLIASLAGLVIAAIRFVLRLSRSQSPWISLSMRSVPILFVMMIVLTAVQGVLPVILVLSIYFSAAAATRIDAETGANTNIDVLRAGAALGLTRWRLWYMHIRPAAVDSAVVQSPVVLAQCVSMLFALDFLGSGLPLGGPSLGEMLDEAIKGQLVLLWWISLPVLAVSAIIFVSLAILAESMDQVRKELR